MQQSTQDPIVNTSTDAGRQAKPDVLQTSARRIMRVLDLIGVIVSGALVVFLMLLSVFDVGMRQWGSRGITGTIEWTEVLLVIMVFAGLAPAEVSKANIRTPLVTNRLPDKWAHGVRALAQAIAAVFVAWLAFKALTEARLALDIHELKIGVVEVPVWPAKFSIAAGLFALCAVMICRVILHLDDLKRGAPARDEEFEGLP